MENKFLVCTHVLFIAKQMTAKKLNQVNSWDKAAQPTGPQYQLAQENSPDRRKKEVNLNVQALKFYKRIQVLNLCASDPIHQIQWDFATEPRVPWIRPQLCNFFYIFCSLKWASPSYFWHLCYCLLISVSLFTCQFWNT